MTEMMVNYLPNTSIYLKQRKDMFRINTDTALLGGFMNIQEGESVLDIGTNNGALLLYASLHKPSLLCGIDIHEEAIELASENLKDNEIKNFELYTCPLQEFSHEPFDVIVCNPPYFVYNNDQRTNENEFLKHARHEEFLKLEELCACVKSLLKDHGRFYMVHRSQRLSDIMVELSKNNLGVVSVTPVYDENKPLSTAILIEAIRGYDSNVKMAKPIIVSR